MKTESIDFRVYVLFSVDSKKEAPSKLVDTFTASLSLFSFLSICYLEHEWSTKRPKENIFPEKKIAVKQALIGGQKMLFLRRHWFRLLDLPHASRILRPKMNSK